MQIPAVMFIEAALDSLKDRAPSIVAAELKEFGALGNRLDSVEVPEGCSDVAKGYLIGIETARVLLAGMPAAAAAHVSI
jgi:hypothetical protein